MQKTCFFRIVHLNQKCFLESNHGYGDFFYKSKLPEVQINLHFRWFRLVKIVLIASKYQDLTVYVILICSETNSVVGFFLQLQYVVRYFQTCNTGSMLHTEYNRHLFVLIANISVKIRFNSNIHFRIGKRLYLEILNQT